MSKAQIFIAEDDPSIAEDLKFRIESLGYGISGTTAHAQEALFLVQQARPDLVLMDIQLRGEMDGIEAAQQLHTLDFPVVFVTGYWDGPVLERAKQAQPYGYVVKPYETRDLKTSVELGLHKHRLDRERHRLLHGDATADLLSICAYCKSIKEQPEKWILMETFITKLTGLSFSHGMCPDCFEKVKRQLDQLAQNSPSDGSLILG